MSNNKEQFRLLKAEEIQCRAQTVKSYGFSLLLYKDARCDINILNEEIGVYNWQRKHDRDNANCSVGLWDSGKSEWVWKEDTGVESYNEKEKGLASDSFKRACFNWGLGIELYTAPFIWIKPKDGEVEKDGDRYKLNSKAYFYVDHIAYDDNRQISELIIRDKDDNVRFTHGDVTETENNETSTKQKEQVSEKSKEEPKDKGNKTSTKEEKDTSESETDSKKTANDPDEYRQHIIQSDNTEDLITWYKTEKPNLEGKETLDLEGNKKVPYKTLMAQKLDELEN